MTYHRSPLSGHGHPPWGPEGGAWWRYDQGWTPNIQGPWYAGGANIPSGELFLQTVPSPSDITTQQAAQQAMMLSRQAIEAAQAATAAAQPQALWIKALNWVKDHPFIAGGAIIVVAMAAQRHGMISNGRKRRGRGRRRNPYRVYVGGSEQAKQVLRSGKKVYATKASARAAQLRMKKKARERGLYPGSFWIVEEK